MYLLGRVSGAAGWCFQTDLGEPGPRISDFFALALMVVSSAFIARLHPLHRRQRRRRQRVTPVLLAFPQFLFFLPTALFLIALADTTNRSRQKASAPVAAGAVRLHCW